MEINRSCCGQMVVSSGAQSAGCTNQTVCLHNLCQLVWERRLLFAIGAGLRLCAFVFTHIPAKHSQQLFEPFKAGKKNECRYTLSSFSLNLLEINRRSAVFLHWKLNYAFGYISRCGFEFATYRSSPIVPHLHSKKKKKSCFYLCALVCAASLCFYCLFLCTPSSGSFIEYSLVSSVLLSYEFNILGVLYLDSWRVKESMWDHH